MLTDWQIHSTNKWTTVGRAPVGLLQLEDGTLLCKSEYRLPNGACECIIISSGEFFHGQGDSARCKPLSMVFGG